MTLPHKFYEALKFIIKIVPTIVAITSGILGYFDIADKTVAFVSFCIGAVGTIATVVVEYAKSNHYKLLMQDGTVLIAGEEETAEPKAE